jgi:hypothetical protein
MLVKLAIAFLFVGMNLILAYHDAERIKLHLRIYHGLNALLYILLLLPVYLYLKDWFFIIGLLSLRRVVFDTSLNIMRGLRFDYISSTTTSIIDKLSYNFQVKYGYVLYYGIFIFITILSIIL